MRRALSFAAVVVALTLLSSVRLGSAAGLSLTSRALTPIRSCTITGTPTTTTAVADAGVREASPSANFGTAATVEAASQNNANRRVYVRFDLATCSPAIPTTATIRSAWLRLWVSGLPAACRTYDVFRVTAAWTEAGITWNGQPFGAAINNPAAASRTTSFTAGTPVGCGHRVAGYLSGVSVTADVATFVSGSATNFGWMIRDDVEASSPARTATFSSKDLGTIAQAPQLIVSYVTAP